MKINKTLVSLILINGMKEGFFVIIAPNLPEQLHEKEVNILVFTPLYM